MSVPCKAIFGTNSLSSLTKTSAENSFDFIFVIVGAAFVSFLVADLQLDELPQTLAQESQPTVQLQSEAMTELSAAVTSLAQAVTELNAEQGNDQAQANAHSNINAALAQASAAQAKAQAALTMVQAKATAASSHKSKASSAESNG